jgi:hypothetical protein
VLHLETVEPHTLGLIKSLLQQDYLAGFDLVGGTALALQIGHRKSVDIDLFSANDFSGEEMLARLSSSLHVTPTLIRPNTLLCIVENVKVDLIKFSEPNLQPLIVDGGVRMKGIKDIACMKLAALSERGAKKDFCDVYFLLQLFSLNEMLEWYKQKTGYKVVMHVIRSLAYFDDAENTQMPVLLKQVDWKEVKKAISLQANQYIQ